MLHHDWYRNLEPNLMANNEIKYQRIDTVERARQRAEWNRPIAWPLWLVAGLTALALAPAVAGYRRRQREKAL
jgi:hypothetical protein